MKSKKQLTARPIFLIINKLILSCLLIGLVTITLQAQEHWEKTISSAGYVKTFSPIELKDSTYLVPFTMNQYRTSGKKGGVYHISRTGKVLKTLEFYHKVLGTDNSLVIHAVKELSNGNYMLLGKADDGSIDYTGISILLDKEFKEIGRNYYKHSRAHCSINFGLEDTKNKRMILIGGVKRKGNHLDLTFTDLNGKETNNVVFSPGTHQSGISIWPLQDGNFIASGHTNGGSVGQRDAWVMKLDPQANILWERTMGTPGIEDSTFVIPVEGGNFITSYSTISNGGSLFANVVKLNSNGATIWSRTFRIRQNTIPKSIVATSDGYVIAGTTTEPALQINCAFAVKMDTAGNMIWKNVYGCSSRKVSIWGLTRTYDGGYLLSGRKAKINNQDAYVIKVNSDGEIGKDSLSIAGSLFWDKNVNCAMDSAQGDQYLSNHIIKVSPGDRYLITDRYGRFSIKGLQKGNYTLKPFLQHKFFKVANSCLSRTEVTVGNSSSLNVNLGVDGDKLAILELSGNIGRLRPCFTRSRRMAVANRGNADSKNVRVLMNYDPLVEVDSSSTPFTHVKGDLYAFDLGRIDAATTKQFTIYETTSCDAKLGQFLLQHAEVRGDSTRAPTPDKIWDGSSIAVHGKCDNGKVTFVIKNNGLPMRKLTNYRVYRNGVSFRKNSPIKLNAGDSVQISFPANGSSYHVQIDQSEGHPGMSFPRLSIEGCGPKPVFGYLDDFGFDDEEDTVIVICDPVRNSWDPNRKLVTPAGTGNKHFVLADQRMDYHIDFQNTGTDTAYNIVVEDPLSENLNVETFKFISSSHNCRVELDGRRVKFVFENIYLPDSFVNEPLSNGWVKFSIEQVAGLNPGDTIENGVAIYFDNNHPIFTNRTFNVIFNPDISCNPIANIDMPSEWLCQGDTLNIKAVGSKLQAYQWLIDSTVYAGTQNILLSDQNVFLKKIKLVAQDGVCTDTTETTFKFVRRPNTNFVSPEAACLNSEVVFKAPYSQKVEKEWIVNEKTFATTDSINLKFSSNGVKTIRLNASLGACVSSTEKKITVRSIEQSDIIVADKRSCVGQMMHAEHDIDWVTHSKWMVNGIKVSDSSVVDQFIDKRGTYKIKLIAWNNLCIDSAGLKLDAFEELKVDFTHTIVDDKIHFKSSSVGANEFRWTIDQSIVSRKSGFNKTIEELGEMSVCLWGSNLSCEERVCKVIDLNCTDLTASYGYESNGLNYTFEPESAEPLEVLWDFGDGTFSEERMPNKTFDTFDDVEVCLYASKYGICEARNCQTIVHDQSSVIANSDGRSDLSIYPVPAKNSVSVTVSNSGSQAITIFDMLGKEILKHEFENSETIIDLSTLESGMYFYQHSVNGANGRNGKLVIEN